MTTAAAPCSRPHNDQLRTRKCTTKTSKYTLLLYIIAVALLLQSSGVFLVSFLAESLLGSVNVSNDSLFPLGYIRDRSSSIIDDVAADDESQPSLNPERVKEWQEIERQDPRQHRLLYSKSRTLSEATGDRAALDDYGSRLHVKVYNETNTPYLIVGGSDGSGTRAVVNTLIELGTFFHVEDQITMDIHGEQMFQGGGWPPLVNLIINHTRSANYQLTDLPDHIRQTAVKELEKLKKAIERKITRRIKHLDESHKAVGIRVAWKAPVAMLLIPLLRQVFGPIKFLHVVRDGRDVSFSTNKSPVKKFYNTFYGLHKSRHSPISHIKKHDRNYLPDNADDPLPLLVTGHEATQRQKKRKLPSLAEPQIEEPHEDDDNVTIKAMSLWNDWNYQVNQYGKENVDGSSFDYMVIRSEDLVNPETKLQALLQLADFVGSQHSLKDLCCQSKRVVHDLGKSNAGMGGAPPGRQKGLHDGPRRLPMSGGRIGWPGTREKKLPMRYDKFEMMESILHGGVYSGAKSDYSSGSGDDDNNNFSVVERMKLQHRKNLIRAHNKRVEENKARQLMELLGKESLLSGRKNHTEKGHVSRQLLKVKNGRIGLQREMEAPEKVLKRYGKWVERLENEPELSQKLHELGAKALKTFGYDPPEPFLDPPDNSFRQQCEDMLQDIICLPEQNVHHHHSAKQ